MLLCLPGAAFADQLDWDTVTYPNGSLSNNVTIGSTLVNITISGGTGSLTTTTQGGVIPSPAVTVDNEGGLSPVQKNLNLTADFPDSVASVVVTVSFKTLDGAAPRTVSSVNFSLFDVDIGGTQTNPNFVDQIRNIQAMLGTSPTVIQPAAVTGSSANIVSGDAMSGFTVTGLSAAGNTGAASNAGNVLISFGPQAISSFRFTYGNVSGGPANPSRQAISLHDINFIPAPEPASVCLLAGGGLCAGALALRRRRF